MLNPNQILILDECEKCNNCHTQYCGEWISTAISKYPKYADAKHTPKTKKKKDWQNKRKSKQLEP